MLLPEIPASAAALIGFSVFAILALVMLAVSRAKRDVSIDITLFEIRL